MTSQTFAAGMVVNDSLGIRLERLTLDKRGIAKQLWSKRTQPQSLNAAGT